MTQRETFTLYAILSDPARIELQHVHDFATCSDALHNAFAFAQAHPGAGIAVWLNRRTVLWQRTPWYRSEVAEQWTGPAAEGVYEARYSQDPRDDWAPTFRRVNAA